MSAAVATLLDRRSELFGVAETAQVLADEVIERGEADAAAVLVPDGGRWRVSGGVGLRPLERRLLLDTSHWLISEIAVGGRALLIEDTDIVRPRLAGAPLAAWRHLLAVPVPSLRAAVVLARGQEAARFTERDLAAVVPLVAEAKPLLQAALRMRELARHPRADARSRHLRDPHGRGGAHPCRPSGCPSRQGSADGAKEHFSSRSYSLKTRSSSSCSSTGTISVS